MHYFRLVVCMLGLLFANNLYAADADANANSFALTTNAFLDTGALPVLYTCDGKDISPDFSWSNAPSKTKAFAIVMSDPDATGGTFYHWILFNIPATTKELSQGMTKLPAGALLGSNSWNKSQYNGPCPPKGSVHTYMVTLYALDNMLSLPAGVNGKTFMTNVKDHVLQKVQMTAVYSRWVV